MKGACMPHVLAVVNKTSLRSFKVLHLLLFSRGLTVIRITIQLLSNSIHSQQYKYSIIIFNYLKLLTMSSESDSSECSDTVPEELLETAKKVSLNLLPAVSRQRYTKTYNEFKKWQKSKNTKSFSEEVFIAYFAEITKSLAPSTMWARFSMLKATLQAYENINISTYNKLIAFLKRENVGYKSKKAKVFTAVEVQRFIDEAPDNDYLAMKTVLIFGITGACRREELTNMKTDDVKDNDSFLLVTVPKTKTGIQRSFTVTGNLYGPCKKYMTLRPTDMKTNRFFLMYRKGIYLQQPIGINTIGNMPSQIAKYLNIRNPESYTGHSFRRTSATLLVDAGADITTLKRHGGWKSNSVAEGYIEDSIMNKRKIGQKIEESVSITAINRENYQELVHQGPSSTHKNGTAAKRRKISDQELSTNIVDITSSVIQGNNFEMPYEEQNERIEVIQVNNFEIPYEEQNERIESKSKNN